LGFTGKSRHQDTPGIVALDLLDATGHDLRADHVRSHGEFLSVPDKRG